MIVGVRLDDATRLEPCRHRADNGTPWWIVILENLMHQWYGFVGQQIPAFVFGDLDVWPAIAIGKYHDHRLRMLVNLVLQLSELVAPPSLFGQVHYSGLQRLDVIRTEIFDRYSNIHGVCPLASCGEVNHGEVALAVQLALNLQQLP